MSGGKALVRQALKARNRSPAFIANLKAEIPGLGAGAIEAWINGDDRAVTRGQLDAMIASIWAPRSRSTSRPTFSAPPTPNLRRRSPRRIRPPPRSTPPLRSSIALSARPTRRLSPPRQVRRGPRC
jgi:hypothetical protein